MFFKQLLQSSTLRLALIALVLCGVTLVGSRSTGEAKAAELAVQRSGTENATNTIEQTAPNSSLAEDNVQCKISEVSVHMDNGTTADNIFIDVDTNTCNKTLTGFYRFVIPNTNPRKANQALSIALSAFTTGRAVSIIYNTADANNVERFCGMSCRVVRVIGAK